MPPKATFSRQQVLDAAMAVVRSRGLSALSARSVAQQLGCSTQPLYRVYGSIEQLRTDVLEEANRVAMSFLLDESIGDGELPFLQMGLGNLRFAQQEPQLFQAVALSGPLLGALRRGEPPPDFALERMRGEPLLANLSDEQLGRIHALMWFFSQGLATLFLSDPDGDPMPMAEELVKQAGQAVIAFQLNEQVRRES